MLNVHHDTAEGLMDINIQTLVNVSLEKYTKLREVVTTGMANEVMAALKRDIPPPPPRGAMVFKSERQRRFVMAAIKRGDIRVPYMRASSKSTGSANLQASYRIANEGQSVILYNDAPYVQYVVGNQQADIHKGRWKTADMAVQEVVQSGTLDLLVQQAIAGMEN
jgi:hypothetical protein